MKKKKFSQFEFPQNPAEIYLVGYEVGTGEDGDNTSVQIKASDLAFSVSGAAGVSSVNGISGSVFLNAGDGVQLTQTGNGITISASSDIVTDDIFNPESTNPQSGVAINGELSKYANLETSNIFSGDVQMNKVNITKQLRVNAPAAFNDEVTISGRNISEAVVNSALHIANSNIHLNENKLNVITQAESHINDAQSHITSEERISLENVDNKLDMKDFYGGTYATRETVPTGDGEWDACRIAAQNVPHDFGIKYITFKALKENDVPLFLAVFRREGNNRSLISVTENSNTWAVGDDVTWRLPLPVIIAENTGLEILPVRSAADVSGGNVTASGIKFKSPIVETGNDSVWYNGLWYDGRGIYAEFSSDGHVGDASHITHAERILLEKLLERADELLALL